MVDSFNYLKIEEKLGYSFKDKSLINMAFCHSSYANEKKKNKLLSYERLEFLGDSVVNFIVSEYLYNNCKKMPEGELTRIRAIVVCEATFYRCIKELGFGEYLLLGKGEELTGGRGRVSILADIFETISGAIFLDGGIEETKKFVLNNLIEIIDEAVNGITFMDFKTELQEILQKDINCKISYKVVDEFGPDHNKTFVVELYDRDNFLGSGKGKSKKEAEQAAAKVAVEKLQS